MDEYENLWCNRLLDELRRSPMTTPFRAPVDPVRDHAANYFQIVTNPMDFGTMKKKLHSGQYQSIDQFTDDIKLICSNAKLFNGETSMFGLICDDILKLVEKHLKEKCSNLDEEWFNTLKKHQKALEEHIQNAPPEVSFVPAIALPEGFNQDELTDEQKAKINEVIPKFKDEPLKNIWSFLNRGERTKVLQIIGNEIKIEM